MDYELVVVGLILLGSPLIAYGYKLWLHRIIVPRRYEFINRYKFETALRSKFSEVYPGLSSHEIERVFDGLLQFFKIAHLAQEQRIAMPSRVVDDAWHQFILFTADYAQFCKQAFGKFYNHTPSSPIEDRENIAPHLKRTWVMACKLENVDPRNPIRIPLLFSLDAELKINNGHRYELVKNTLHYNTDRKSDMSGRVADGAYYLDGDLTGINLSCSGISCAGGASCGGGSCGGGSCGGGQ